jgi:hypothetical protein
MSELGVCSSVLCTSKHCNAVIIAGKRGKTMILMLLRARIWEK